MGWGLPFFAAGRDGLALSRADTVDSGLPHEECHALVTDALTLLNELGSHA